MINNKRNFSLNVFERASICRHFENEVYKRVVKKEIEFPVYLSAGQEYAPATIAEIGSKKKIKPLIFGQHRGHSIYLSFGGDINKLIKELKGKKDGCTYGMGGSLSIHSMKINMYGHDGFMGSNACIGTGACFSSKKPTIIFIGDAALEEDYVLASLSWVAKKKLPILDKKIINFYNKFRSKISENVGNKSFALGVSGGPDSLCLAYFSKIYSIEFGNRIQILIIDHRLRKESFKEAQKVKNILEKKKIKCKIITWHGPIPR